MAADDINCQDCRSGSAGGANDFLARALAEQIGRAQGLAFTIANRTGAGGIVGAEAVSRSAAHSNGFLIEPRACKKRIS
jgi:tripartite-type tricarboxylate transporter receptor subunit TctC